MSPFSSGAQGLEFDDNDVLYGVEPLEEVLRSIHASNGTMTTVLQTDLLVNASQALHYDSTTGFMYAGRNELVRIDLSTGTIEHVGTTGFDIRGMFEA